MWTPWQARQQREQQLLGMIERLSFAQAEAFAGMTAVMATYLKSFETDGPPRGWTNDERSEYKAEHERLMNEPDPLPPARDSYEMQRLQFMLHDLDG
jgi:hypothetical protein